jgi:hypothetical protein
MTSPVCPACGTAVPDGAAECPGCHLSVALFDAVREAAGGDPNDPNYVRAIGDILKAVDLAAVANPSPEPSTRIMARPPRAPALAEAPPPATPVAPPSAVDPTVPLPALPAPPPEAQLKRQVDEYLTIARRSGVDTSDFKERAAAAMMTNDAPSLEVLARDLFVHLSASLTEEYSDTLSRRNDLAQLLPTPSADVELQAAKGAIGRGDLAGAARRLRRVAEELGRLEEEWEVVQILTTENDLLAETVRDLGGDPTPALGPLVAGRAMISQGRRADAEQMLARGTLALWSVLQPPLVRELQRIKGRILERRDAGEDVEAPVEQMRVLLVELKKRNFVGTIVAYRRLRIIVGPPVDALDAEAPASEAVAQRAPPNP